MTQTLEHLQILLRDVFPLIDSNLNRIKKDWQSGKIARSVFEFSLARHAIACEVLWKNKTELDENSTLNAVSTLFIDLRTALNHEIPEHKIDAQTKINTLHSFYIEHGFTETHPLLGIPCKRNDLKTPTLSLDTLNMSL